MKMGYRRSSVRTSGTFWGKSPYADGLTYGMYGTDGDYNNSLTYMFGEMTDRFGFMVFTADRDQIEYEDGFDTDYDAEVAAESWIEQNASQYITASVASRKISYYDPGEASFFGEDIDPGDGLYGTVWFGFPEDGEHAFNIEAVEKSDGTLQCDVMSPEDYDHGNGYIGVDSVDSFTATDWGNMYDVFNQRFTFGPLRSIIDNYFSALYDDDDHDEFASVNRDSRTKTIASDGQFVFYDEKFNPGNGLYLVAYYGPENDKRDSLVLELEGDAATYFTCTVKSPDGTVIDTFTVDDWESYKSEFYGEMDYGILDFDEYLNDWMDRKYGVSAGPNTASRKLSNNRDYVLYGMRHAPIYRSEYNGGNLDGVAFYGPKDDIDNSIDIEIVGDDQIGYECEPITPMGHILDAFYADTWSDIPNAIGYEIDAQHFKECLDNELYLFERDGTWIKDTRILSASREPRSAKVHKTAKRKMTMKEKLALINEDKLDEEDDPINPFF